MNQLPDSGDNLQIKFWLLISQNRFEEADTLLREHPDEFVEIEGASLANIRFFPVHAKAGLGRGCRSCCQETRRNREKAYAVSYKCLVRATA